MSNNPYTFKENIDFVISKYKENFATVAPNEQFKWEAIAWYKSHWNIDAEDFGTMVKESFSKLKGLAASGNYYPYKILVACANDDPERVRNLFRVLYDETLPLDTRYKQFRKSFEQHIEILRNTYPEHKKAQNHYQDYRAILVYLTCEYPEKYFFYKWGMYADFRDRTGYREKHKNSTPYQSLLNYLELSQIVLEEVEKDQELLNLCASRLTEDCYQDENHHLLTMEIIWYGASYMKKEDFLPPKRPPVSSGDLPMDPDDSNGTDTPTANGSETDVELNTILYGPPGTGKTYHTVIYAVAIIENKLLADVENEDYTDVLNRYNTYKKQGRIEFTTFHQSYGYEEFIEGIKPEIQSNPNGEDGSILYKVKPGIFKKFCEKAECSDITVDYSTDVPSQKIVNYVFIIDEINRGNLSKIFGELITLIEASKRKNTPEALEAILPYSQKPFGIPANVYIIGTMNTADRSIAAIDTALRRRFNFREMLPDPKVLDDVMVEDLSISNMLSRMNKRIQILFDREHTIGHAYFIELKKNPTVEVLAKIFRKNIIPLLQEYFYEDYEKIRLVLADNQKENEEEQFIIAKSSDDEDLFGDTDMDFEEEQIYVINEKAFDSIESYRSI